MAKHAAVLRKSGIKASDKGPTKYFGIPQTPREYRESIPPAVLERVRRDYPSRRDARSAEDDLGDFYEVRQVYIDRLELEGWDDNGQEVPLSKWDVQRVREAIREHKGQKSYPV